MHAPIRENAAVQAILVIFSRATGGKFEGGASIWRGPKPLPGCFVHPSARPLRKHAGRVVAASRPAILWPAAVKSTLFRSQRLPDERQHALGDLVPAHVNRILFFPPAPRPLPLRSPRASGWRPHRMFRQPDAPLALPFLFLSDSIGNGPQIESGDTWNWPCTSQSITHSCTNRRASLNKQAEPPPTMP